METVPVKVANRIARVVERTLLLHDTGFVEVSGKHSERGFVILHLLAPLALVPLIPIVEIVIGQRYKFFRGRRLSGKRENSSQLIGLCLLRGDFGFRNIRMPFVDREESPNYVPDRSRRCTQFDTPHNMPMFVISGVRFLGHSYSPNRLSPCADS